MRSTIATATFAALAAGTVGVGALDTIPSMVGSDTLKQLTTQVINSCKASGECLGLGYIGTGSGNGQSALSNNTQSVAPMSRALNSGICTNAGRSTAEGLVVALDALSIAGNPANVCAAGLDFTGAAPAVTSNDWRNVLRQIYTGMGTASTNILTRDCNNAARVALLNDWDAIFRDSCTGKDCNTDSHPSAGTAASPPAQRYDVANAIVEPGLRHAFRRDEESGTTDVFLGLLNLGTISFSQNGPTGTVPALTTAQNNSFRSLANSAFCNVRRPTDTYAPVTVPASANGGASVIPETVNLGVVPAPASGAAFTGWDHDGNAATPVQWRGLINDRMFPEFQEQDPVRRRCVGTNTTSAVLPNEQVCSADGKLGVVLPINPPPLATLADVYPTVACASGDFEFGPGVARPNGIGLRCPNGDEAVGAPAQCRLPRAADGSFNCLNRGGSWALVGGSLAFSPGGAPAVIDGETPGETVGRPDIDGRAYNLILRDAAGNPRTIGRPDLVSVNNPAIQVPVVGAFYRIHSTRSLLLPPNSGTATCQKTDATQQLGCLVLSSPCSLSFAGAEAVALNPGSADVLVNGIEGTTTNVQNLVTGGVPVYPFARKLYINSLKGFHNPNLAAGATLATDGETDLVRHFFSDIPGTVNPASIGFVALPFANFCEDFNETAVCGSQQGCTTVAGRTTCTTANANACAAATTVAGIPDNAAYCGNGIVETGEACDDGNLITDPAVGDATNDTCSVACAITL